MPEVVARWACRLSAMVGGGSEQISIRARRWSPPRVHVDDSVPLDTAVDIHNETSAGQPAANAGALQDEEAGFISEAHYGRVSRCRSTRSTTLQ